MAGGDRAFVAGQVQIVQRGLTVGFHIDHDHPGYASFRARMEAEVEARPSDVLALRHQIRQLTAPHSPSTCASPSG